MAGLVPAQNTPIVMARLDRTIHEVRMADKGGWIYIMTNKPRGTLYVGVTSDLSRRVYEHREGAIDSFTTRYGLKMLVYAERHETIEAAIQRETRIKKWPRAWKIDLIRSRNPDWNDLYETLL